jgi:hypothetical protein
MTATATSKEKRRAHFKAGSPSCTQAMRRYGNKRGFKASQLALLAGHSLP